MIHGPGATRKFRGGFKVSVGARGGRRKSYVRDYYYKCEQGRGGQVQSRLSFSKTTPISSTDGASSLNLKTTSTEGQSGNGTTQDGAEMKRN